MTKFLDFPTNVFLAPMAGITDYPLRKLVASKGIVNLYSEMVAINAINRKNPKTYRIADVSKEPYPVVVQLVGNDPELFSEAAKLVADLGAHSLDINMGCPVKKIVGNNSGSALMKDIKLASQIIKATVSATNLKVSVKFRKGWDNNSINAVEFAKMCEESGASYVTIHGRTRAQGYSGVADWNVIKAVKKAVSIPVIGNGDIKDVYSAKKMLEETNCDAIMIGRATLGNPWIIKDIIEYLEYNRVPQKIKEIEKIDMCLKHLNYLQEIKDEKVAVLEIRNHIEWYLKGISGSNEIKNMIYQTQKINDIINILKKYRKNFEGDC